VFNFWHGEYTAAPVNSMPDHRNFLIQPTRMARSIAGYIRGTIFGLAESLSFGAGEKAKIIQKKRVDYEFVFFTMGLRLS